MSDHYSVPLKELIRTFNFRVEHAATDIDRIRLTVADMSRPGLQLAGYFDHFEPVRLQLMGNVEISYLAKLTPAERSIAFDRLFSYKIPALVIARDTPADPQCLAMAKKHNITVLRTKEATSAIISAIIDYMSSALAPRITRHGVLMEVYGEGILLIGESGIGKSEAAVELLKRGHRLIADDAVEIHKVSGNTLMGSAPKLIRNYIELRGIGIINARRIFGVGAVKLTEKIDMVINLEPWEVGKVYDRMGLEGESTDILGLSVPSVTIPVKPGRNLAVIIEVAAMNNRQKKMGYNAAKDLLKRLGMDDGNDDTPPNDSDWYI